MTEPEQHPEPLYVCANCQRRVDVVFYIGNESDNPRWACDICVTSQKPT